MYESNFFLSHFEYFFRHKNCFQLVFIQELLILRMKIQFLFIS